MPAGVTRTAAIVGPVLGRESLTGRRFQQFQVQEQLGAGGMGVVYRAVDTRLGRSVALKFLSSPDVLHRDARGRFLCEARAASALDHPNIGTIYGVEEGPGGELCIVMAYYDGETLADRLARGRLPVREALRIALAVASGLSHAHAEGIIHRDIKPSNILLTANGGVKIVDFGLATCAEDGGAPQTRSIAGTVAYMSPEQARGAATDERTDVWSLGVVLYEMLAGERPFQGGSTFALLHAVVREDPRPIAIGFGELERAVSKALDKAPASRFATMSEFAAKLERATAAIELESDRPTVPVRVQPRRRWRLKWPPRAAVVLAMVCAAVALWLTAFGFGPSPQPVGLAVVPFESPEDPGSAALARGLSEALSARISILERFEDKLRVIPNSELSSKQVADPGSAWKLAGATLAVTGVLHRESEGKLRLDLELHDHRGAAPVKWSVADASGDTFALEHRAAAQICAMLDVQAAAQAIAIAQESRAAAAAYESYLRGLGHLQRWDKPGNLDAAIAALTDATRADPDFALAWAALSEAARTRFRTLREPADAEIAVKYAQQAVRLNGKLPDAHVSYGRALQDTGQRDLAVNEFQRALELDSRSSVALLGMARAREDMGQFRDAETAYKRAVALAPYSWAAQNNLAGFFLRRSRYRDAEAQYRRAMLLTPDNPALLSNLGVVLLRAGRPEEAARMLRRSIDAGPSHAAYLNLGNIHYRARRFGAAAEAYERALEINSTDFRIWGTKAQALRLARRSPADAAAAYRHAIQLGEQSLRVAPGQARTMSLLAIYYASIHDRTNALRHLEASIRQANGDNDVLVDAAITYELLGDRANATRSARTALERGYPAAELQHDPDLEALALSGALRAGKG